MEYHKESIAKALKKLMEFEPDESVWKRIDQKLGELPLQDALTKMPSYEPNEKLWELIETDVMSKRKHYATWWFAAAAILVATISGLWMSKGSATGQVSYSEEKVDNRLQAEKEPQINDQYQKLKAFCESETLVCSSKDFKRLKQEYETLDMAAGQLKEAMGGFNTEPELMRQYSIVEQGKAEVLNEMAKLI